MQNNEKTSKRGVVGKFALCIKWLLILILAGLLTVGLIFKAPWKVNTLLVILIIVPTIVPKVFRKYIFMAFALVIGVVLVWLFVPRDDEGWEAFTFEKEITVFEGKLQVPDEDNAAIVYNSLFDSYDYDAYEGSLAGCLPDDVSDYARDFFTLQSLTGQPDGIEKTFDTLLEASRYDKCLFRLDYIPYQTEDHFNRLRIVKLWAKMLDTSASEDVRAGDTANALDKYTTGIQLSNHLYQQPAMLDFLVGAAIESMVLPGINEMVMMEQLISDQLTTLDNLLASGGFNWQTDFPRLIDYEKLSSKHSFAFVYQMNKEGSVRCAGMHRQLQHMMDSETGQTSYSPLDKLGIIVHWFVWPRPDTINRVVNENYSYCYEMADPKYPWTKSPPPPQMKFTLSPLTMLQPVDSIYHRIREIHIKAGAARKGARFLIRLHRYHLAKGEYPETIEEILEPDDKPLTASIGPDTFVYRRDNSSIVLYNTGPNGVDDSGILNSQLGADDFMVWPVENN